MKDNFCEFFSEFKEVTLLIFSKKSFGHKTYKGNCSSGESSKKGYYITKYFLNEIMIKLLALVCLKTTTIMTWFEFQVIMFLVKCFQKHSEEFTRLVPFKDSNIEQVIQAI